MIKILQTGISDNYGGTEVVAYNYYEEIDKSKFHIDFVTSNGKAALEEELLKSGAKVFKLPHLKKHPFKYFRELEKILKEEEYDIVHININNFANFILLVVSKKNKVSKIILHAHNTGIENGTIKIILHNLSRIASEKLNVQRLACSEKAGKWMFKNAPFIVLDNSINHDRFKFNPKTRQKIREKLGIKQDEFLIGSVGRLCKQKNYSFLIKIFNVYHKLNPKTKLLIVGGGVLENELKNQIKELNLDDSVIMTGFKQDTAPYYQAMDLFCLPSIFEGLGIVGIEAQVAGLPCIFSDNCVEELEITEHVNFISLEDELLWIEVMNAYNNMDIERNIKIDKYDIKKTAQKLELIYLNKHNN